MKIKEVTIGKTITLNLGNYESAKFSATFTAEVEEGDSDEKVAEELRKKANEQVLAMADEME